MYLKFLIAVKILFFIFSVNNISFAQETKIPPAPREVSLKYDLDRDVNEANAPPSPEIEMLTANMMAAKRSGDIQGVLNIQKELDRLTGSVTLPGEKMDLKLIENEGGQDNINSGLVSQVTGVKGINTCTEQIGSTATRIWTAFVYGPNSGPVNDLLRVCYSDDGGRSWNEKATIGFSSGNRMWSDEIDIELIENTTGDKYLYVAFGYATNNYSGQYKVGVTIVKITGPLNFNGFTLNWPTTGGLNYYYRPRIVSDNEAYRSNPWIYIACCFDSAVSGGYMSGEKVARVNSPYTTTPLFTYKSTSFYGLLLNYPSDFHCDIAYFRNGGQDSILLVESSLGDGDSSGISIVKSSIAGFVSSSTFVGVFNVTVARRYQAYIASGGGYNSLMIVNLRKYNATDWDIEFFRSTTGSTGSWSTGYVDFTGNNSTRADISGFRSAPGFYSCAYASNDAFFPLVSYCYASNNNWGPVVLQMNHVSTNPFIAKPRPGVRYGPEGQSCFAVWTEYSGGTNVWASVGCSGPIGSYKNIFFRGVIEGFWSDPYMVPDTITLLLRRDVEPFQVVDSAKALVDNDGYGNFWFTRAQSFTNYYIVVKHRNSIETWSASTFQFTPASYSYNFTFASFQAYGSNMVQVPNNPDPLFAFYSGDVNQDGIIDASDLSMVNNDVFYSVMGYVNTDVNGDNFVDASDLSIVDNNAYNSVAVIRP